MPSCSLPRSTAWSTRRCTLGRTTGTKDADTGRGPILKMFGAGVGVMVTAEVGTGVGVAVGGLIGGGGVELDRVSVHLFSPFYSSRKDSAIILVTCFKIPPTPSQHNLQPNPDSNPAVTHHSVTVGKSTTFKKCTLSTCCLCKDQTQQH